MKLLLLIAVILPQSVKQLIYRKVFRWQIGRGARAMLISCEIPAGAVVGAGSVVTKSFAPEPCRLLIAGNPAAIRKRYE